MVFETSFAVRPDVGDAQSMGHILECVVVYDAPYPICGCKVRWDAEIWDAVMILDISGIAVVVHVVYCNKEIWGLREYTGSDDGVCVVW